MRSRCGAREASGSARRPRPRGAVRAAACAGLDPTALRFLDAIRFAVPADGRRGRHVHPGLLARGLLHACRPAPAAGPAGLGHARLRVPGGAGRGARRRRGPTVSISGDGGFLFACGELATMAQEQIPLTAVIVDDGGYGMLRYDQVRAGTETFGVDLHTPDFEAMARVVRRAGRDGGRPRGRFGEALPATWRPTRRRCSSREPDARAAAQHVAELVPQRTATMRQAECRAPVARSDEGASASRATQLTAGSARTTCTLASDSSADRHFYAASAAQGRARGCGRRQSNQR